MPTQDAITALNSLYVTYAIPALFVLLAVGLAMISKKGSCK